MRDWRDEVFFYDTEVLPHDWLFCAIEHATGDRIMFHNNGKGLQDWLSRKNPLLCGYNTKHYDQYILKAILAGGTPEDVKEVNDAIIVQGLQGWEIDMGWIQMPYSFDLMLDLPTMPSLKMIEGNLHMSIEESSVSFNCEHPTAGQWEELVEYCWHDVESLIPLYKARMAYLESKEILANMMNPPMDVREALNMTNAKLTAKFLHAIKVEHTDEREYVYPENIRKEMIPSEVFTFFNRLPDGQISLEVLFGKEGVPDENGDVVKSRNPYKNLLIDIAGVPHVVGWGGLHGAKDNYTETSDDARILVNTDVASYYPSLMIVNNYLSRNLEDPSIFTEVVKRRLEAKASGDKKMADALKLVVNTTYGASNNQYNDLFDPLMAHSVCISGQLYLIELIQSLSDSIVSFRLVQSNTDGILFSVERGDLEKARTAIADWELRTGFTMEETLIDTIVQRDVNNYVMREASGKVKVKGGVVSDYKGGEFKHNSLAVVCRAVVNNLLDGVPVAETILNCNDIFDFQMISKAGHTYEKVVHSMGMGDVVVNKTNRIYAGIDERLGAVYKVKKDGRRDRIANCPEHAIVDNSGTLSIDKIQKEWYIEYANRQLDKFRGIKPQKKEKRKMGRMKNVAGTDDAELEVEIETADDSPATVETKSVTRRKTVTEAPVAYPTFMNKMFNLGKDVSEMAKALIKDGYNSNQSYEYVKAQQYKSMLRECLLKNRLMMTINDMLCNVNDVLKSEKMVLTQYHGQLTIHDIDSVEKMNYMIWSQGSDNLDKGLSKAKTLAIKDFVKANFLVSDSEDDVEADVTPKVTPKKFVTPAEATRTTEKVMGTSVPPASEKVERLVKYINALREVMKDPTYGAKTLEKLPTLTDAEVTVNLSKVELKANEYGLEF